MHDVLRPLEWVGSSKDDLKGFPAEVRDRIGFAPYQAQLGAKHRDAKPLTGMGPGVLEVVSDFRTDTYRAVYAVRFREAVYVLHSFQKKAKRGIATPKSEIELVKQRLKAAERHYRATYAEERDERH
jgi:phage-related protein